MCPVFVCVSLVSEASPLQKNHVYCFMLQKTKVLGNCASHLTIDKAFHCYIKNVEHNEPSIQNLSIISFGNKESNVNTVFYCNCH